MQTADTDAATTPTTTIETPWLRVREAVQYSNRSESLILTALRRGELRGYQRGRGGTWTIHREDLEAWIRGTAADVEVPSIARGARRAG